MVFVIVVVGYMQLFKSGADKPLEKDLPAEIKLSDSDRANRTRE